MEETLVVLPRNHLKHKVCVEYLGRYTHKIAISNHRIRSIDTQNVTFDYKDYRVAGALKQMTLTRRVYQKVFLAYYPNAL
jgi:hypothetical protein